MNQNGTRKHETGSPALAQARSGNLDVLLWLKANGCPWDKYSVRALPRRLSGLSISHSKSVSYGGFVWARRALTSPQTVDFGPGRCG